MNDFTKEELEELLDNIDQSLITVGEQAEIILSKLQSMIDNYCEHEIEVDYSPYGLCKKCGVKK